MTPALVLFDIDGTLVLTGRAGSRGLNRAFEELYGSPDALDGVPFAGRTDRAIVFDVLERLGETPTPHRLEAVRDVYQGCLAEEIVKPTDHPFGVMPGVLAALDGLAPQNQVSVGLLTGNFAVGAAIKLTHFDLWRRFSFGAFGDDHRDRRQLVPVAVEAAARAGRPRVAPDRVVVIGDTPLDVDCAHANGARAVAVATGPFSVEALRATGADVVVENLSDWDGIWAALGLAEA